MKKSLCLLSLATLLVGNVYAQTETYQSQNQEAIGSRAAMKYPQQNDRTQLEQARANLRTDESNVQKAKYKLKDDEGQVEVDKAAVNKYQAQMEEDQAYVKKLEEAVETKRQ